MKNTPIWRRYRTFWGRNVNTDLEDELGFHLEGRAQELIEQGWDPRSARQEAQRLFGKIENVRNECLAIDELRTREVRRANYLDQIRQDVGFAMRQLRRNPGFACLAVLTLALGIGANTAIFSAVEAVVRRPLPFEDPDRLVMISKIDVDQGSRTPQLSYPDFADIRQQNEVFEDAGAAWMQSWTLTESGAPVHVRGLQVTPGFLEVLGVAPLLGRTFNRSESDDRVVVVSHRLWQDRYGSDPDLIGRGITLDGGPYSVIGVLPSNFDFELPLDGFTIRDTDVWMPLGETNPFRNRREVHTFEVIARLESTATIEEARANLEVLGTRLESAYPDTNTGRAFELTALYEQVGGDVRPALLALLGAAGFVLLITCANVASLLLTRASSRQHEMGVRAALGAGRGRTLRQLFVESIVLSGLGGTLGLALAWAGTHAITAIAPADTPRIDTVGVDTNVLLFAGGLSLLTGIAFGFGPALISFRTNRTVALEAGRTSHMRARGRLGIRNILVVSEVALAMVLLIGAGLFTTTLINLLDLDPGFESRNKLTFVVSAPASRYPGWDELSSFLVRLRDGIDALPEVGKAALASSFPLSGHNVGSAVVIEGRPLQTREETPTIGWQAASPDFVEVMDIPLFEGRGFEESDRGGPHVTIIKETLAEMMFPGENPIGRRIHIGPLEQQPDWHEIIGIVGDVRHQAVDTDPRPRAYDLFGQHGDRAVFFVVDTEVAPEEVVAPIRALLAGIDPDIPLTDVSTGGELVARSTSDRLFLATVVGSFAVLALGLAAIGIYGVVSYSVESRTSEIGIRMALGAERSNVLGMILAQGSVLSAAGIGIGGLGALALTRFLSSMLFGVGATDPIVFVSAALLMVAVALIACYVPARRAARVDPLVSLRHE